MNHYILTRAYRGPDYPLDASRRRIELLRGITAQSLAAQDTDWTWLVYVNPNDPLLAERMDAFRSAGHPVWAIETGDALDYIDWSDAVLTTRIDDDDAFTGDAFRRLYHAASRLRNRAVLMFPVGYRINEGLSERIFHTRNAWSSLYVPHGDRGHIRQATHPQVERLAKVRWADRDPAWLWVRHQDAESGFRRAHDVITPELRDLYPIDWALLEPLRVAA